MLHWVDQGRVHTIGRKDSASTALEGNQLPMDPPTCTFWCAVALGALVKGTPVDSVRSSMLATIDTCMILRFSTELPRNIGFLAKAGYINLPMSFENVAHLRAKYCGCFLKCYCFSFVRDTATDSGW